MDGCKHEELEVCPCGNTVRCKKCGATWIAPQPVTPYPTGLLWTLNPPTFVRPITNTGTPMEVK